MGRSELRGGGGEASQRGVGGGSCKEHVQRRNGRVGFQVASSKGAARKPSRRCLSSDERPDELGERFSLEPRDGQLLLRHLPRAIATSHSSTPVRRARDDFSVVGEVRVDEPDGNEPGLRGQRGSEEGRGRTDEMPWCARKEIVVRAVVSCPPCWDADEVCEARQFVANEVPREKDARRSQRTCRRERRWSRACLRNNGQLPPLPRARVEAYQ